MKPKKPIILVCGLSGSGKSELVDFLGKSFHVDVIHSSGVFRMLREKALNNVKGSLGSKNQGWWESSEGQAFTKERLNNLNLDQELDHWLLKRLSKGNAVVDSWTMPWLFKGKALRIWLESTIPTRAKRIAVRNHQPLLEVLEAISEKELQNKKIYQTLYGFDMQQDHHVFDVVINTEHYSQKEVAQLAKVIVKEWMKIEK